MTENSDHRFMVMRIGELRQGIERILTDTETVCQQKCYDSGFCCIFWRHGCTVQKIRDLLGPCNPDGTDHLGLDGVEDP